MDDADNAGNGEQFSISTQSADSFDCGSDCVTSPTSTMVVDPDAPSAVDAIVGGPEEPAAAPGSPLEEETVHAEGAGPEGEVGSGAAEASAPPQGLLLLPMGMEGDVIRQRRGPAGMSGGADPAPI